ncbi:MAG: hypothetical protein OXG54_06160 [Gammaproteobacteria bacterium]|nr:hypothetical protein [Gammaproteobacteria bacterium]
MSIEEQWAISEKRLLEEEADSFGEVLELLRGRMSPLLIGGQDWEGLLGRARELPATMAAFPFGFELPLHERRPRADLGVSVVGGSGTAAFFVERGRTDDADQSAMGISQLVRCREQEEAPLRQIIGTKMMLEYDIDSSPRAAYSDPGFFLRPAERPIIGDGADQRFQDIGVVYDALASAAGWNPDPVERRQVEQVYRALNPDTYIESFGVFPSRDRALRLTLAGFRKKHDVMEFLERTGWRGQYSVVDSTVSRFEKRSAFVNMAVHFDVRASGLGPTLGLSFLTKDRKAKDPRYWVDTPQQWTVLLDCIREEGLAVPEKLSEMANWQSGAETLFGSSGNFVLMRGIHHIKLVLEGDRFGQVKAYIFLLVCSWPQDTERKVLST